MNSSSSQMKYLLFPLLLFISAAAGKAQTNVSVISDEATIYTEPNIDSPFSIGAQEGDIFEAGEVREGWVQIQLFSGANRYIKSSEVEGSINPSGDSDTAILNKLCSGIESAQNKATREATAKYDQNISRQEAYEMVLFDKYVLSTYRKLNIPTSYTSKLLECVDDSILGRPIEL